MKNEQDEKKIADELVDNFEFRLSELKEIRGRVRTVSQELCEDNRPREAEGSSESLDVSSKNAVTTLEDKLRKQDKLMADEISEIMYELSNIEKFI